MPSRANSTRTPGKLQKRLTGLIAGFRDHVAPNATLTVAGVRFKRAELLNKLEELLAPYLEANEYLLLRKLALERRRGMLAETSAFVTEVTVEVKSLVGSKSPDLEKFGITPPKTPTPLTAEQEVRRVAKAAATRKARGTLGPRQREAIKGEVPPPDGEAPTTP